MFGFPKQITITFGSFNDLPVLCTTYLPFQIEALNRNCSKNMTEEIQKNLSNPQELEKLYRNDKVIFKREFNLIYPEIKDAAVAQVWYARLNFETQEISWGTRNELLVVMVISALAGLVAKIPDFASLNNELFYQRNISFIVLPFLMIYFIWKQGGHIKKFWITAGVVLMSVIYINVLPNNAKSDTLMLACIHLPLFLWALLGFTFVGNTLGQYQKRLDFLRYNGDLVVMTTIILIAGGLLTGVTLGLFSLIDIQIEQFYFEYIAIWGLAAAPIVGTYLVQTNPQLVNKVSPVIARVFTPLVLITLVAYLAAIIFSGKDPYNDREFLLIFNIMLIGVMAIIFFSISEISKSTASKLSTWLLWALSLVTVAINAIALSAIVFRISSWGTTPNRLAVLGGNVLMLINLITISYRLLNVIRKQDEIALTEKSIAEFLPIYTAWTVVVTFLLPLVFGFR